MAEEREKLNQSGIHYSEMLPLEYKPTPKYMEIYNSEAGLEYLFKGNYYLKNVFNATV